jgi:WD40 repeat protein
MTIEGHEDGMQITDLQMSSDRTYFITASKDKTAKVPPPGLPSPTTH